MRENKKGVSGIVVAVIMIALVMAAGVIVWVVIKNMVEQKTKGTESCFGNFEKVTLNPLYTCFDSTGIWFSISIADIDVDAVLVSMAAGGATKSFEITNTPRKITDLANYSSGDFDDDLIKLPGRNEGLTYITNFHLGEPDSIEISPIINGNQCGVSDSMTEFYNCSVSIR